MSKQIRTPEEIKEAHRDKQTRQFFQALKHPRCLEFCSVSEAFTPKECKLICPGRFKKDSLPEA